MKASLTWVYDTQGDLAFIRSVRAAGHWKNGQRLPRRAEADGRLGRWILSNQVGASVGVTLKLRRGDNLSVPEVAYFEDRAIAKAVAALLDAEGPRAASYEEAGFVPAETTGEGRAFRRNVGRNGFDLYRRLDNVWLMYQTRGANSWHNVAILGRGEVRDPALEADLAQRYDAAAILATEMFIARLAAKRARRSTRRQA